MVGLVDKLIECNIEGADIFWGVQFS